MSSDHLSFYSVKILGYQIWRWQINLFHRPKLHNVSFVNADLKQKDLQPINADEYSATGEVPGDIGSHWHRMHIGTPLDDKENVWELTGTQHNEVVSLNQAVVDDTTMLMSDNEPMTYGDVTVATHSRSDFGLCFSTDDLPISVRCCVFVRNLFTKFLVL